MKKKSPCFDKLERYLKPEVKKLKDRIICWQVNFKDHGLKDVKPDGGKIDFGGRVGYEGCPSDRFWDDDYFPECLRVMLTECISIAERCSKEYSIYPNRCLNELEDIFLPKVDEIYKTMSSVDAALRGDGKSEKPIDVSGYVKKLRGECSKKIEIYRLGKIKSCCWYFETFISPVLESFLSLVLKFFR